MKNKLALATAVILMITTLTSCEAIGGIFKAGMWTGIIFVVLIIVLVIFIIGKLTSKK